MSAQEPWLVDEIAERGKAGQALAGRFPSCRVYRGNGQIDVIGPVHKQDTEEVNKLKDNILRLKGHVGWQGGQRRAQGDRNGGGE